MKVISDTAIRAFLLNDLTKETLVHNYVPLLVSGLEKFQSFPDAVPERTVRSSTTDGSDTTHLFMPCILPNTVGLKVISGGPSNSAKNLGFQGSVSVLDAFTGELRAILNAKTLTAFRTALASCVSLVKVFDPCSENKNVTSLSIFGAGPQAFWHAVLATRLYPTITDISVVSRSKTSAERLSAELRETLSQQIFSFGMDESKPVDYEKAIQKSSIVFGCTPSTEAIIKSNFLANDSSRTRFVSLIGSYKPHMIELDLAFINEFFTGKPTKIIVDSESHCLSEAGELIQGKIPESQLCSLTDFYRSDSSEIIRDVTSTSGVILQKLVGLSVMDIVVAKHLAEQIDGHVISEF